MQTINNNNCVQTINNNNWNHLIVCKQMSSGLFKNITYKVFIYKLYMCVCVCCNLTIFSNCSIAGFAEGFLVFFWPLTAYPLIFFQRVGRGWPFLSFWPKIFFFVPWAVIRDTFFSCSWPGFFFVFFWYCEYW